MAKITRHICDFNPNVKEHDAQIRLVVEDKSEPPVRRDIDSCAAHLLTFVENSFLKSEKAKHVMISKLVDGEMVFEEPKKTGRTYKKEPCGIDGCTVMLAPQGRSRHIEVVHPEVAK